MVMKNLLLLTVSLSIAGFNLAQQHKADSLMTIISHNNADIAEVNALVLLANQQTESDSAIKYAQKGLLLAQKLNYRKGEADCFFVAARSNADFSETIPNALSALSIYKPLNDKLGVASAHLVLQAAYREARDYRNALMHALSGEQIAEVNGLRGALVFPGYRLAPLFLAEIGQTYLLMNQLDSAELYTQKSIAQNELFNGAKWNFPIYLLATIQSLQGNYQLAMENYHLAIPLAIQNGFFRDTIQIFSGMSTLFRKTGELDSSIYYARIVANAWTPESEIKNLLEAVSNLAQVYKMRGNGDSALKYTELSHALEDSILSNEKDREVQNLTFNERLKQQEILAEQAKYKSRVQLYTLSAGLFALFLLIAILWRNNRQKQKAKSEIERAYSDLKATQSQLIQSEKMASLGELTAGIAHEIQNPLNFVKNFSEVSNEMIDEMNAQLNKGDTGEAKLIAAEIKQNLEKINHHGKRADEIVKSMLQHSRGSSGKKELTDINALVDEYLRLAYHGMRAKDKFFSVTTKTDLDNSIGKMNIIPQDMGKVILNLINNAFYAVDEKKKALHPPKGGVEYEPTVTVSTKKFEDKVLISVKDNGIGISQTILDKIFQPFFTTKPTGQGTGLGLSLSYDIVKAHGGEIKIKTKEEEGAEFVVSLPGNKDT